MSADPRDIENPTRVGTPLRDAAVDPVPGDFLPPVNAGKSGEEGNPHGPNVYAPGIHGEQGIRPVRPGAVDPVAATQSTEESTHASDWQSGAVHTGTATTDATGTSITVTVAGVENVDPVDGYAVSTDDGTSWSDWQDEPVLTASGLTASTEYTVRWRVQDVDGNIHTSNPVTVTTAAA